jgi:hypothetical protein
MNRHLLLVVPNLVNLGAWIKQGYLNTEQLHCIRLAFKQFVKILRQNACIAADNQSCMLMVHMGLQHKTTEITMSCFSWGLA